MPSAPRGQRRSPHVGPGEPGAQDGESATKRLRTEEHELLWALFSGVEVEEAHNPTTPPAENELIFGHEVHIGDRTEKILPVRRFHSVILVGRASRRYVRLGDVPPSELLALRKAMSSGKVDAVRRLLVPWPRRSAVTPQRSRRRCRLPGAAESVPIGRSHRQPAHLPLDLSVHLTTRLEPRMLRRRQRLPPGQADFSCLDPEDAGEGAAAWDATR